MTVPGVRERKSKRTSHSGSSILDVDPGDDIYFSSVNWDFGLEDYIENSEATRNASGWSWMQPFSEAKIPATRARPTSPAKLES